MSTFFSKMIDDDETVKKLDISVFSVVKIEMSLEVFTDKKLAYSLFAFNDKKCYRYDGIFA